MFENKHFSKVLSVPISLKELFQTNYCLSVVYVYPFVWHVCIFIQHTKINCETCHLTYSSEQNCTSTKHTGSEMAHSLAKTLYRHLDMLVS